MNLPTFCIKRPVFATVLSLLLIVFGIMGFQRLNTRFFPKFIHNTILIMTPYPGASANLVENTVTTPLEKSISGITGIETMTSTTVQGSSSIKVKVIPGTNLYDLTNKIRNKVSLASATLPSAIKSPIVQLGHSDMDLMDIGFSIKSNNLQALRNYLDRFVINRISQIPGISAVQVFGANRYAINIRLNPDEMKARQVSTTEISQAIQNSSLELPAGQIKTPTMDIPVTAKTSLHTAKQFANIVVKNAQGVLVHLKDVATVKLGSDTNYQSSVRVNGQHAILLSIFNATNANPITASKAVRQVLNSIKQQLPNNISAHITFDQANFMKSSISEVYKSIIIAIICVGLIIFFTLGKIRAALIPIVTIPICIMATTGFMYLFGFTINIITLLAIVLSIGLVVDDAIVVLENISRHVESGYDKLQAAMKGSKEITTPIIAMTLTLAAVYAPIGLIKGSISHIFASFAFTLCAAVLISGFIALTLSPMMCAKILESTQSKQTSVTHFINRFFNRLTSQYHQLLTKLLNHRIKIIVGTIIITIAGFMVGSLPKAFMPKEDMGFVITQLTSQSGANNDASEKKLLALNKMIQKHAAISTNVMISSNLSTADDNDFIFSTLKPFSQRNISADTLATMINKQIATYPGLNAFAFSPSFGGSTHQQISFYVMAPTNYKQLYQIANGLISQLQQYPGIKNLHSNLRFNNQQYEISVNRPLAANLNVSIRNIDNTLANFLGGSTVATFSLDGQTYNVIMQAATPYLQNINNIRNFEIPTATNQFVPLADLINIKSVLAQPNLFHYNRLRAARITGELGDGFKLSDVVHHLQHTMPQLLPNTAKYAFTGQARRIVQSSNTMTTIFILALVFIYLVLSAQFESFLDPLIILLAVPLSIVGAIVSLKLFNGTLNIYTLIGLVTLVGLIAKHGILITQFANTLQKSGHDAKTALIQAASIRLRPILMTTGAMVFGALPLLFASGASANSREQIGIVIVGGLLFGTFFSLILVPVAYSLMANLKLKIVNFRKPNTI